jgi:hypothetical protein
MANETPRRLLALRAPALLPYVATVALPYFAIT